MSKPYTDKSSSRSPEKKDKVMQDHKLEYKENIMTIPNLLTTMRIVSTPFLGYMVTTGAYEWGLGLFVFAGLTDLLDGYIARSFTNQRTALGTALDPLADKLLVSVLTITLTIVNLIPVWLTSLIVSRDMALIGASFYIRYISLSPPKNFSRFFNLNKPSAKLYPSTLSKANTALQLSLVALTLAAPVFNYIDHPALQTLWYITAVTTFWSGWDYWKNGWSYVKILPKK
ncbi:hypothetical protein SNE40_010431 [Patella caerulea]|uniref:cardiolipin synthase (CMP-forming) n=1 Tax=Patella caerulea TaxID=87958 RepID=A0AAN8JUA6_PATCE